MMRSLIVFAVKLFMILMLLATFQEAKAQVVTGHYPPGFSGLKSGILPPGPGFFYQNSTIIYNIENFRDGDGGEIPNIEKINTFGNFNALLLVKDSGLTC